MEVKDLKNYGKALSEITARLPMATDLKFKIKVMKLAYDNLGFQKFFRFMSLFKSEMKEMQRRDFSKIREKGLDDKKFIKSMVDIAAMYSSFSKLLGEGRAIDIFKEIMEITGREVFPVLVPLAEECRKCDEPFEAYKEYLMAMNDADREAGCHFCEITENTGSTFQVNYTYCAWYEIAKLLGCEKIDFCYADDVFFSDCLKPLKIKLTRTNTLLRGGPCCDFRFERE